MIRLLETTLGAIAFLIVFNVLVAAVVWEVLAP